MNELDWLKAFKHKFYSEGGWTKEDLHSEVTDRIAELEAEAFTERVQTAFDAVDDYRTVRKLFKEPCHV